MITSIVFASFVAAQSANALPQKSLVSEQELTKVIQVELMSSLDKLTRESEQRIADTTKSALLAAPLVKLSTAHTQIAKDANSQVADATTSVSPN